MVEDLDFADEGAPHGLSDLLHRMIGEIGAHEEGGLVLFPAIRRGAGPGIDEPIVAMRADHDGHEKELADIRRLTHDLTPPERACTSWITLYAGLAVFAYDLTEHIRLENDVLFPRFEKAA